MSRRKVIGGRTFIGRRLYAMACFEPGHYEAGMKGVINVVAHKH